MKIIVTESRIVNIQSNEQPIFFIAHAAIVAINEAIDKNDPDELFKVLSNPEARILNLYEANKVGYRNKLSEEKARKTAAAEAKV